jgi:hypothetical protein
MLAVLCRFAEFIGQEKSLSNIDKPDVIQYFNTPIKHTEEADPLHKWIGTWNLRRMYLKRFFKWLSKLEVMQDIPRLKRKEQSIYKPTDLLTTSDDLLFLKYCPSSRDRCYHAISRDLSARPHEILKLKIKDVVFKILEVISMRRY